MRSSCLQRFSILHHSFNAIRIQGPGKSFIGCLHSFDYRNGKSFSAKSAYTSSIRKVSSTASLSVPCAVCPSCHKNSAVRRNKRVRISQRTTLAHWFTRIGRSWYDWIHPLYVFQMMVSEVGRIINSSSSFASGSTMIPLAVLCIFSNGNA